MNISRREYIKRLSLLLGLLPLRQLIAAEQVARHLPTPTPGNFQYIYDNPALRRAFLDFLTNVFHLYPEHKLHNLIYSLSQEHHSDKAIYLALQQHLRDIKPLLADIRYALPALARQKTIMTQQTLQLLGSRKRHEGYMEIGSTGRYIGRLEDKLDINGDIFLLHTQAPGYGPQDIVERGQINKIGTYLDMGNYSSSFVKTVAPRSLSLVTVYIGFHHCPLDKREAFISAVRDVIKPGGTLILRDHDAHNEDMRRMAALAHDTFNAGTKQSWQTNENELRNFYSLQFITDYLGKLGLRYEGSTLFQKGDPTRNGLMAFTRV